METTEEIKYWVAWSHLINIGPQKFKRLMAYFPDMKTAWQAGYSELLQSGFLKKEVEKLLPERDKINPDKVLEYLTKNNIQVITIKHKGYPALLKEIYSPPALLYIKGQWPIKLDFPLAVVGTRKTSAYGRQITPEIVTDLAKAGLTIISGLALGIDTLAHQAALAAGATTIAVLGHGLDRCYPASNRQLVHDIINNNGAIISEFPPGTTPLKHNFPIRNRIISGLSKGVLVIEGAEDSGSLITARNAVEQNRDIFAVPGNISAPTSRGPNKLIKLGACLVTKAEDILESLDWHSAQQFSQNKKVIPATAEEEIIIKVLSSEPVHIDEIIQQCKLKASVINSIITMLEMKGTIRHLGGMNYVLSR